MTFNDCARAAAARLTDAGLHRDGAERDAALLLRHHLGWEAARWLAHRHDAAPATLAASIAPLVDRRAAREPMNHITGTREFWGRTFAVTPAVLIPRWETELLVETALSFRTSLGAAPRLADIGTGSGCIAVTLGLEWPGAAVWATDVSSDALDIARRNAERHGVGERLAFGLGEMLAGRPGPFEMIVSNPPYVPDTDRPALAPEVVDHEPPDALFGGPDGLTVIRQVLQAARSALAPEGRLVIEIGFGQADAVARLVAGTTGLALVDTRPDLQGIPRVVVAARR